MALMERSYGVYVPGEQGSGGGGSCSWLGVDPDLGSSGAAGGRTGRSAWVVGGVALVVHLVVGLW